MRRYLFVLFTLWMAASPPPSIPKFAAPSFQARFPHDHGSHPGYRTEWWYVTGHLWTAEGRRFGFELSFFRLETPTLSPTAGSPAWRTDEIHLAHAALSDLEGKSFHREEKLNRAGVLAGSRVGDMNVFNENWKLHRHPEGDFHLEASIEGRLMVLDLTPKTPVVRFGKGGYVQKGKDERTGSLYFTFPNMATVGSISLTGTETVPVKGQAWMDHEISSMHLAKGIAGWDWAGVQLKDGRCLMMYKLRGEDGSTSPWSMLSEIDAKGTIRRTTSSFRLEGVNRWTSPKSGATYPLPLRMQAWGESMTFVPLLADQEVKTRHATYWEGACKVLGGDGQVIGEAYVELTGYAHSMQGRL